MTTTTTPEYLKLELDSSNDIIRHDARRSDRKYPEAALHARDAGLARLQMGQMMSSWLWKTPSKRPEISPAPMHIVHCFFGSSIIVSIENNTSREKIITGKNSSYK